MTAVYCVLKENYGWCPIVKLFYTTSEEEASKYVTENNLPEYNVWYVKVDGFTSISEANEYIEDMKNDSFDTSEAAKAHTAKMEEKWGANRVFDY